MSIEAGALMLSGIAMLVVAAVVIGGLREEIRGLRVSVVNLTALLQSLERRIRLVEIEQSRGEAHEDST